LAPPDVTLAGHSGAVLDLVFSPDSKRIASVADDGMVKIWSVADKKELFSVAGLHNNENQVRFTPDGKSAISLSSENTLMVLDAGTGKPLKPIVLGNSAGGASALDLSPDGKTVAVAGRGIVRLFDVATGAPKGEYEAHKSYNVTSVAFSADGKLLATAGTDNMATILDAASGKVIRTLKISLNGVAVAFSHDGKKLFVSTTDRVLSSFDLSTGESTRLIEKGVQIFTVAAAKDGKSLVGGPGHSPWIVTLPDGKLADPAYECEDWVKAAASSPNGQWIAGGGNSGTIYLWKIGK
jgi:WD40 repeat protein